MKKGCALPSVAKTLDGIGPSRINSKHPAGFLHCNHPSSCGGITSSFRASDLLWFVCQDPGLMTLEKGFVFVHHPGHRLRIRVDIRCWDILVNADVLNDSADVCPREILQFSFGHISGIAHHTAFSSSEWEIHDSRFPRHPASKSADRISRLIR